MNWKKLILTVVGGAFAGTVGHWAGDSASGVHVPFTAGNIVLPALVTIGSTLVGLFTQPPHTDGTATTTK